MSRENVEIVRRIYDQAKGDFWALAPLLDPQITWDWGTVPAMVVGATVYHGPAGVPTATKEWLEAWERFWIVAEEFFDADDHVVAFSNAHAKPRHGGPEVELRGAQVWTVREGLIISYKGYSDRAEALKAVGLSE